MYRTTTELLSDLRTEIAELTLKMRDVADNATYDEVRLREDDEPLFAGVTIQEVSYEDRSLMEKLVSQLRSRVTLLIAMCEEEENDDLWNWCIGYTDTLWEEVREITEQFRDEFTSEEYDIPMAG